MRGSKTRMAMHKPMRGDWRNCGGALPIKRSYFEWIETPLYVVMEQFTSVYAAFSDMDIKLC
jgi:hypothetical protein